MVGAVSSSSRHGHLGSSHPHQPVRLFFCCRRFVQIRREAGGGGKIINVTSVHDEIPRAGAADYDSSKGGQQNLIRTLALELAPMKINVNNIGPGMVLTPFNAEAVEDREADAGYVTGATFYVDGGLMQNQAQGA